MRHLLTALTEFKVKVTNSPFYMGLTGLFEAVIAMIAFFVPKRSPFAMLCGRALDPPASMPDG